MSAGTTPPFEPSPARFTCTSAGTSSRRAALCPSTECTSSQTRFTTFTLFDWSRPMKCQRNASPYSACLASRSWARFSPTTWTPASTRTRMSWRETYFVAATTVTPEPTSARTRSYRSRTSAGDNTDDPLPAGDAGVAAVREEELRVARGAEVETLDRVRTGAPQQPLGGRPEIELPSAGEVGVESVGDLRADLVAARPDRGADAGGVGAADRGDARLDDALEQATPAGVED